MQFTFKQRLDRLFEILTSKILVEKDQDESEFEAYIIDRSFIIGQMKDDKSYFLQAIIYNPGNMRDEPPSEDYEDLHSCMKFSEVAPKLLEQLAIQACELIMEDEYEKTMEEESQKDEQLQTGSH